MFTEILKATGLTIGAIALVVLVLYVSPFARCRRCGGKGCKRCTGGRYQRRGSRTVHRLALAVSKEIERTRAERAERSKP